MSGLIKSEFNTEIYSKFVKDKTKKKKLVEFLEMMHLISVAAKANILGLRRRLTGFGDFLVTQQYVTSTKNEPTLMNICNKVNSQITRFKAHRIKKVCVLKRLRKKSS